MRRPPRRQRHDPGRFRPAILVLEDRRLLSTDILTYHVGNGRTGLNPNETLLTPADVNSSSFGKLFTVPADGKVDAQPLIKTGVAVPGQGIHDVLYVATEHDSVYAYDANTGAQLWKVSLLGAGETPSDNRGSDQVTPEIGVTATPVIDPATDTLYVVAMSKLVSNGITTYFQRLHALDIATGADKIPPKEIDRSIFVPGRGPGGDGLDVRFNPDQYKERDALLLVNGIVYTSWASHSDIAPYTGWVMGFRADDLSLASVVNIDPNGTPTSTFLPDGSGSSFWNSGDGPAADSSGNIYNISANGPFNPALGDYGDSFVKFSTASGLSVADYFTPFNQQAQANADEDLGSSGLLLADVQDFSGAYHHLAIGSGKDGNIYVVDRDNMGKFNSGSNSNVYQEVAGALGGAEFAGPAFFNGSVYFGGVDSTLRSFQFSNGRLPTSPTSQTANTFGYPGTTPSISSNGGGDGIVWAAENGGTAVLHAYDALNLSRELYNSNQAANGRDHFGAGNKFITPAIANGKVYVGTTNGVGVFGLLPTQFPVVVRYASASPNPVAGTSTALSVLGAEAGLPEAALSYHWRLQSAPAGAPAPTFSVNDDNAAKDTTATFGAAGDYFFLVFITDPQGRTAAHGVGVTVTNSFAYPVVARFASASPNPVAGTTTALSVLGSEPGAPESSLRYYWRLQSAPAGAPAPTFSVNDDNSAKNTTATFGAAGDYFFLVFIVDPSNGHTVASGVGVTVTNSFAYPVVARFASASPNPVAGTTTALSVLGSEPGAPESSLRYYWRLQSAPAGAPAPTFSVNDDNSAKNTTATFGAAGDYFFLVFIVDPSNGHTVASGVGVTVTNSFAYPVVARFASASPNPVAGTTTALSVLGSEPGAPESSLRYYWRLQSAPAGAPAPTFSVNDDNSAKNTTATFGAAGDYFFLVFIVDPSNGHTVASGVGVTVTNSFAGS